MRHFYAIVACDTEIAEQEEQDTGASGAAHIPGLGARLPIHEPARHTDTWARIEVIHHRGGKSFCICARHKSSVELSPGKSPVRPYLAYSPRVLLSAIRGFVRLPSNWHPQMRTQHPLLSSRF